MIRNKELRSIIIKILVLNLILLAIGIYGINIYVKRVNNNIIERDFAIVGGLIELYPGSQETLVSNITKTASESEIKRGREVLERYGYTKGIREDVQPLLKERTKTVRHYFVGLISLFTIIILSLICLEYRKIYLRVQKLSRVSEQVMEGDFSVYLDEAEEGDFNILNHHFNQMSRRLENSLDILKEEKIYLKDTISNISHQLKTPLSSLGVINDILLDDPEMDSSLRLDFLQKSRSQLMRMEWLILNLLKVARIEAGAIEFKREEILLKTIVDLAIESLKPLLKTSEIEIDGKLDAKFIGDLDWTVEALINIIKNGAEHDRGKLWVILEESPLFVSIRVRDNGKGIDNRDIKDIFKRFYKVKNNVKSDSIGIGLNLSKLIVEAQDGTISVSSKKDIGTEFTIRFLKNSLDKDTLTV